MELTLIGGALLLVSVVIFATGSTLAMFATLLLSSLMGGSAALLLPALGKSSIPPVQFVLPFLVARILLADRREIGRLALAIKANLPLLAYVGYGIAAAVAGPRIFARRMEVPPLRNGPTHYLFDAVALVPTSQNITTSVYLLGTLLVAICAYVVCMHRAATQTLLRSAIAIAWIHVFLGISDLVAGRTAYGAFLGFFRNATYAQLDQSFGSFVRIKGIFPETSGYVLFAVGWFTFLFECWFRGVRPRATGPAALALALAMIFSTSGTAYVTLSAYAALLTARTLLLPRSLDPRRAAVLAAAALAAVIAGCAGALLVPRFADAFGGMIGHMTLDKSTSPSGLQRLFWARKGFEAFFVSNGLGIGPGSFRSSSLLSAILGSCGVVGIVTFTLQVARSFRPLRASTYLPVADERTATGVAASWAMLVGLIPAFISSPSADPGIGFAIFSGCALALRGIGQPRRRARQQAPPGKLPHALPRGPAPA